MKEVVLALAPAAACVKEEGEYIVRLDGKELGRAGYAVHAWRQAYRALTDKESTTSAEERQAKLYASLEKRFSE